MNPTPKIYPHVVPRFWPAVISCVLIAGIFVTLVALAFSGIGLVE